MSRAGRQVFSEAKASNNNDPGCRTAPLAVRTVQLPQAETTA